MIKVWLFINLLFMINLIENHVNDNPANVKDDDVNPANVNLVNKLMIEAVFFWIFYKVKIVMF
jgi:hypothetical protein